MQSSFAERGEEKGHIWSHLGSYPFSNFLLLQENSESAFCVGFEFISTVQLVSTKSGQEFLQELLVVKHKGSLLLGSGGSEPFDKVVKRAQERVRITDGCPGRGSGSLKQPSGSSITDA